MNIDITYPQKKLITILSCILLCVIAYRVFISPDMKKAELLELEYNTACMSRDALINNMSISDTEKMLEELDKYENDFKELRKIFSDEMTPEEISLMITDILSENRISPLSIEIKKAIPLCIPADESSKEYSQETDTDTDVSNVISVAEVSFSFTDKYKNIISLTEHINSINSLCIKNFSISEEKDDMFSVNMSIEIYMYRGELN